MSSPNARALDRRNTVSVTTTDEAKRLPSRWLVASVLLLAAFISLLDASIVHLALPSIQADLGASPTQLQWVLVVYLLTFSAGLLPFGRFGDVFGRERMFLWGLAGFMLTSVASGLAATTDMLIAAQGLKGLAAAMMVPQVLAIIHVVFPPEERGKVIGLFGMVSGLGAVAGPLIGGLLISADLYGLGWRSIFLINLPFGLLSFIGALTLLPKIPRGAGIAADWLGALLFAGAVTSLTYPLIEGRHLGWPAWSFALMALSAVLGWGFLVWQSRLAAAGRAQTLPVTLLKDRAFVSGLIIVTLLFSGIAGVFLLLAIFLQSGFGFSPLQAGIAMAPHPASAMIAALLTGRFGAGWIGARILVSAAMLLIGVVWIQHIAGQAGAIPGDPLEGSDFLVPLLLVGTGMGTATVALFQSTLSRVSGPDAGAGSGVLQAFQQVGIALSIALIGQLFFTALGPSPDQAAYTAAAKTALWYPIGVYAALCSVCLWKTLAAKGRAG